MHSGFQKAAADQYMQALHKSRSGWGELIFGGERPLSFPSLRRWVAASSIRHRPERARKRRPLQISECRVSFCPPPGHGLRYGSVAVPAPRQQPSGIITIRAQPKLPTPPARVPHPEFASDRLRLPPCIPVPTELLAPAAIGLQIGPARGGADCQIVCTPPDRVSSTIFFWMSWRTLSSKSVWNHRPQGHRLNSRG